MEQQNVGRGGASGCARGTQPPLPFLSYRIEAAHICCLDGLQHAPPPSLDVPPPLCVQKKKVRKHRVLLPKGFDASLPGGGLPAPNPERWLPKWQRSEFKKKKITSAQRKNEVVKGSQVRGGRVKGCCWEC